MDHTRPDLAEIFPGSSEMSRRMRAFDWAQTPLGPPETWPDGLKIPLRMLLTSRFEMWLGWGDDLCFFYNDAYVPTLGIKHPGMLGRPFREVWAEVYADVADQVDKVRSGAATWNDALLLLLERSGFPEETYHSFSYSPLFGPDGRVEGLLCIVTEVTERVITQRRLESLRTLGTELVAAHSQEAVTHAAQTVLARNRRDFPFALIYLGGAGARQGIAGTDDAAHLLDHAWPLEAGASGRIIELPEGLPRPSGAWNRPPRNALVAAIPGAADGAPAGHLVLGLNPYGRREVEVVDLARLLAGQISGALANVAALATERRRADRIWSHSRDLLVTITADGIFRSVSPSWTRILGHGPDAVIGRHFSEFLAPEDAATSDTALRQAASGQDLTAYENRFRTADGGVRWISWHTAMEDGLVYAYGRDVTEQKANAEALALAEEALRHAQKMEAVGHLTGGIAHDFNNLLTGITGSLDLIRRRRSQDPAADIERYLAVVSASASRAASLTQRLLAFSRRQPLAPKPVEVMQLILGMADLIRRSIGELIAFEVRPAPGLWRARCDPNQLESAILNLAINARDAMPDGGRLVIRADNLSVNEGERLRHRLAAAGDYVCIAVSDTGHGMSPEVMAKAFDPFFTTKPIGKGTGLGLSMIYGFAQQSGGAVGIESLPGGGTTLSLYLPRSTGASEAPAAPEPDRWIATGPRGATVLVVEDEAAVRALVVEALTEVGFTTIEAADGPAALDILRSRQAIDLLLTDVGLPGLNGRQVADAGRSLRPGLKVLFVTGYAHDAAVGNGELEPGMDLVTKPFAIDRLVARVETMLTAAERPVSSGGAAPA